MYKVTVNTVTYEGKSNFLSSSIQPTIEEASDAINAEMRYHQARGRAIGRDFNIVLTEAEK